MRIIGIELRIRNEQTGTTKELMLIPLDLDVPEGSTFSMPCTIHTDSGDLNLGNMQYRAVGNIEAFR